MLPEAKKQREFQLLRITWTLVLGPNLTMFLFNKKKQNNLSLKTLFFWQMRKQKEKNNFPFVLKPTFCGFFLKEKVSVGLLLLLASFFKETERESKHCWVFFERLQTFNLFCLVDAKEVVGLHRQHNYKVVPTKRRNKEQKLVFFLLVSVKKSCYEIVKERKTCYFGSERKKKLVI